MSRSMNKNLNQVNCTFATIPKEFLEGVNEEKFEYLGLNKMVTVLENFLSESDHIKNSLSTNFKNIIDSKVDQDGVDLINTTQTFASFNKGESYFLFLFKRKEISRSRRQSQYIKHYF